MKQLKSIILASITLLMCACNSTTDDFLDAAAESCLSDFSPAQVTGTRWDFVDEDGYASSSKKSIFFLSDDWGVVCDKDATTGKVYFFTYTLNDKTYKLDYINGQPSGFYTEYTLKNSGYLFDPYKSILVQNTISSSQADMISQLSGNTGTCRWYYDNESSLYILGNGKMGNYTNHTYTPWNSHSFSKVIIEEGVTSIGDYTFKNMTSLSVVSVPSSVTSIGKFAFSGAYSLTISVPGSVSEIGEYAFYGCSKVMLESNYNLKKILKNSLNADDVSGIENLKNLEAIEDDAYIKCSSKITLPSSLKTIGKDAFYNNKSLEVTIPSSVTSIGESAFDGCKKVTFAAASKLKSITAHSLSASEVTGIENLVNLEWIEDNAYIKCNYTLTLPSSLKQIGWKAFYNCSDLQVTIPNGVTYIGPYAFYGCKKVTFAASSKLSRIFMFSLAAANVTGIENLVNLEAIDDDAYIKCSSKITLPNSVKSIGRNAFEGSFSSVVIGTGTETIGATAFSTSSSSCYMYINRGIPPVLTAAIVDTPSKWTVYVPSGCKTAYSNANYWKSMKAIKEDSSLTPGGGLPEDKEEVKTVTVNGVTFRMIAVEGGTFSMGATSEQSNGYTPDSDEYPVHSVTLSDYYIGETEVTQALWYAVMGKSPSNDYSWITSYGLGDNYPAYYISYTECEDFITKLNQKTGLKFRMPTEAEWEYAARGGKKSKGYIFSGSNTIGNVAWYSGNSGSKTHPVGTKAANELGIYDMTGNVWEWCSDWYGSYSSSSVTNPTGPSTPSRRVFRGGSWNFSATNCRVAYRHRSNPGGHGNGLGLRLAL